MLIEFSKLADVALARLFEDEGQRRSAVASMTFYIGRRGRELSIPCSAFQDRALYLYAFNKYRVLWEDSRPILIWSVTESRSFAV